MSVPIRDLHRSARIVVESGWPEDLRDLPGVGTYVATAIRCFALEQPVLPLDVNVRRVLERRFPGGLDISGDPWRAGQAIMEFGQRICTVRPDCAACPVRHGCPGPGPATRSASRRQKPFDGSMRQRRGRLLGEALAGGVAVHDAADREAAAGLAQDGLAVLSGGWLGPPE